MKSTVGNGLLILGFILAIFGSLFKIQHWAGANEVLFVGRLMLLLGIAITYYNYWKGRKNSRK